MTDITDQDLRKALAWAEGSMARGGADAAARYILATVDAPEPTLAEDILDAAARIRDAVTPGDRDVSWADMEYCADRAERIAQERDEARAEVERLTAVRVTDPSLPLNDGSMTPDPADVKPGETWIVDTERYGRAVAFRSEDGQGSPWKFASKISTGRLLDCAITLVSRLMPAPRQITTRGELNALPEGTVVRAKGELVCERYRHRSKGLVWISTGVDEDFPVDRPVLPATVLWTPEETK